MNVFDKYKNEKKVGDSAERKFVRICRSKGHDVKKAKKFEDIDKHWDYEVTNNKTGEKFLVDVKALKKISRSDSNSSSNKTWVEFQNVNGKSGWLKGKADFIAFEQDDHFLLVKRSDLYKWAKNKIEKDSRGKYVFANNPRDALYRLYRRQNRPAEISSLISINDLKKDLSLGKNYSLFK